MRKLLFLIVILSLAFSIYSQEKEDSLKVDSLETLSDTTLPIDSVFRADTVLKLDTIVQLDTIVRSDTLMKTLKGYVSSSDLEGSPVTFLNDTLFFVYAQIGPYSPEERAKSITGRIKTISKDPTVNIDSIKIINEENFSNIVIDDIVLMSVTDVDAKIVGLTHSDLATANSIIIKSTLYKYYEDTSLKSILLGSLWALIATIILVILFKVLGKYFPRLYVKIRSLRSKRIKGIKIHNLEIFSAGRVTDIIISFFKIIRFLIVLLLLYFYLPLVFSFFPWTRVFASKLIGYILSPLKSVWVSFVDFLPNLFFIIVIAVVTFYIVRFVKFLFSELERGTVTLPSFYPEWARPTFKIIRFLIIAFALVIVFPYLPGSDSPAFQGVSIFFGVLLSLGSTSAISNIVAGVVLTYMRPFKIGDRVNIADTTGDVIEKTLLVTRVKTIKNVYTTIPNAMVLGSHIVNYSTTSEEEGLILNTSITIGYDVSWKKVHELLISAALETENILKSPEPFVYQKSLDDFYVSYELNAYTHKTNVMAKTYSDLHKNILDKFNEAGIEIMSPHFSGVRDGNKINIPEENIPKDYKPPVFKIFPFLDPTKGK